MWFDPVASQVEDGGGGGDQNLIKPLGLHVVQHPLEPLLVHTRVIPFLTAPPSCTPGAGLIRPVFAPVMLPTGDKGGHARPHGAHIVPADGVDLPLQKIGVFVAGVEPVPDFRAPGTRDGW